MAKLPNYHACFVCGDLNPAGLAVRFHVVDDEVHARFVPGEPQMGYRGITHGGVLASLLDETMGWACTASRRRFCVSVELNIKYLRPLPIGTSVTVVGRSASYGRRIQEAAGEVVGDDGVVYARGTGRYALMKHDDSVRVAEYLTFDAGCVDLTSILAPEGEAA